jgi:hypothetical protein
MKTTEEIQREAQRMIVLGRQYRDEQRQAGVGAEIVPLPRVLVRLPDSQATIRPAGNAGAEGIQTINRQRHIEAAMEHDELVYRLMERESATTGAGSVVRESEPAILMVSRSGFDLLHTGYQLVEEDRLTEALAPYAGRRDGDEPADERTIGEIEEVLETNLLAHSDRLRTKAEIVEFLEGRLEASAFIARAIDRQCARECRREAQTERHDMRIAVDEP